MPVGRGTGLAIAVGFIADLVFADPRRGHPVAGYGRFAGAVERRCYRDSRWAGVGFVGIAVVVPLTLALGLDRALRTHPRIGLVALGVATWASLGGTSLTREADRMSRLLEGGDLPGARERLSYLCGRDARELDTGELTRATIESVAENTADAVVAPLFWAALAGLPGVVGYRAINTLDAMVGHRSVRYARFGTAAARLDDAANLVPARLTAVLAALLAPVVGGSTRSCWRIWRRDGGHHPSPNAGQCEAAFAGALGVQLGGVNVYEGAVDTGRGALGDGAPPGVNDIARAVRLSRGVGAAAAVLTVLVAELGVGRCADLLVGRFAGLVPARSSSLLARLSS